MFKCLNISIYWQEFSSKISYLPPEISINIIKSVSGNIWALIKANFPILILWHISLKKYNIVRFG